jgi:hypothetical protein
MVCIHSFFFPKKIYRSKIIIIGKFLRFFSYVNLIKFPIIGEILLDFYIKKLKGKRKKKGKKKTNQPTLFKHA